MEFESIPFVLGTEQLKSVDYGRSIYIILYNNIKDKSIPLIMLATVYLIC